MVKQIIWHLGDSKTGSTSLQNALRICKDKALLYPGCGLNHNGLALALSRPALAAKVETRFQKIWLEIEASHADTVVLSGELFQSVPPETLKDAMHSYWPAPHPPMVFVSYVRPHAQKLVAMYSERVKFGRNVGTVAEYAQQVMRKERLDYAPRLDAWRRTFGNAFRTRVFAKQAMFNDDVVDDFFVATLGRQSPVTVPRINASLNAVQVQLMQRVAALAKEMDAQGPVPSMLHRQICLWLRMSSIGAGSGELTLSAQTCAELHGRYREDAAAIDLRYFGHPWMTSALLNTCTQRGTGNTRTATREEVSRFDAFTIKILKDWQRDPVLAVSKAKRFLRVMQPSRSRGKQMLAELQGKGVAPASGIHVGKIAKVMRLQVEVVVKDNPEVPFGGDPFCQAAQIPRLMP